MLNYLNEYYGNHVSKKLLREIYEEATDAISRDRAFQNGLFFECYKSKTPNLTRIFLLGVRTAFTNGYDQCEIDRLRFNTEESNEVAALEKEVKTLKTKNKSLVNSMMRMCRRIN